MDKPGNNTSDPGDNNSSQYLTSNILKYDSKYEQEIRSHGLQLRGECLPDIKDINLSYRDAWLVGKQGCLAVRRNLWDPHLFSGIWYFVCDGTDPVNFLVLHPHNAGDRWQKRSISMWELIDGFWVANKYRILYQPKDNDGSALSYATRTMVIEGFTRNFYEAMIKCIHEGQVRLQMMYHELRDLRKQFTCSDASRCTPADSRTKRSSLGYTRNKDLTSILKNKANDQTDTQEKQ